MKKASISYYVASYMINASLFIGTSKTKVHFSRQSLRVFLRYLKPLNERISLDCYKSEGNSNYFFASTVYAMILIRLFFKQKTD